MDDEQITTFAPERRRKRPRGKPFAKGNLQGIETRFKPGESGNPSGLPGTDLAALYARRFFEVHPEGISEKMKKDLKGLDASAYSKLADRAYGKIKETVEYAGAEGGPIIHTIRFGDGKRDE